MNVAKKYFYDEFYIAGNNKMYLGLKVKCLIFLPNFYQIWSIPTDICRRLQFVITWKSVQWVLHWYIPTEAQKDGQTGQR